MDEPGWILRLPGNIARIGRSGKAINPQVCFFLLLVLSGVRDTRIGRALQGISSAHGEIREAQVVGYYERLVDAMRPANPGQPAATPASDATPPPGWLPLEESGIAQNERGYLLRKMKPNLDVRWNGRVFRTNSQGYRTPEVSFPKPAGVYRIVVFGSSNTMGHGVDDGDVYPRLLEQWLDGLFGGSPRVEVVNLAVAADSPTRRLLRLQQEAARYQPDWLLMDAIVLDAALEESHIEKVLRERIPIPFDFVQSAMRRSGVTMSDPPEVIEHKLLGEFEHVLSGTYAGWAEQANQLGVVLTVVVLPRADKKTANPVIKRIMRSLIERNKLDSLDVSQVFDGLEVAEFQAAPWDLHPSVRGHAAIFEAMRSALLARGTLPGLPLPVGAK